MELFYSDNIDSGIVTLGAEESAHCVRVLRHREGDEVLVIDGCGTLFKCILSDADPKGASARISSEIRNFGAHPYELTLAVCPTKNNDRYEWFAEKATEIGVDTIVPVIGEHSERRVFKTDRIRKILVSAAKQSLKGAIPQIAEPVSVRDFISGSGDDSLKLFACCFECGAPRISIKEALADSTKKKITVMIGPEGDFSQEEARLALEAGFIPVHLGESRLRTETAAVTAAEAAYFNFM